MKNVNLTKASRFTTVALLLFYFGWWLYVIYFFYYKEYSNGYAAATAAMAIGAITAVVLAVYLGFFLLEAKKDRDNRSFYLRTALLLLASVVGIALVESISSALAGR